MKKRKLQRIIIGTSWFLSRAVGLYISADEVKRNMIDENLNKYMVKAYYKDMKARALLKKGRER
ncbi:hypothetical protein [Wielerella bovis]|uniref:hypothetical protein n=1 Tax=Wielerella bovis TaxID=2917790 RepID=UPI002018CA04|nr:hypothetical protein [Wielerella bovis]ULJ66211.1 hypothetical protein MIS31_07995 [Wielerella bovis]ULJ67525.1 hypothetical protein MIS31_02915 [Wielerella bovis]